MFQNVIIKSFTESLCGHIALGNGGLLSSALPVLAWVATLIFSVFFFCSEEFLKWIFQLIQWTNKLK